MHGEKRYGIADLGEVARIHARESLPYGMVISFYMDPPTHPQNKRVLRGTTHLRLAIKLNHPGEAKTTGC